GVGREPDADRHLAIGWRRDARDHLPRLGRETSGVLHHQRGKQSDESDHQSGPDRGGERRCLRARPSRVCLSARSIALRTCSASAWFIPWRPWGWPPLSPSCGSSPPPPPLCGGGGGGNI